jgi:hypothetical protein
MSRDREEVFPFFCLAVLRWAVGAGGFDFVTGLRQSHVDERVRASKFATLVATDESTEGPGATKGAKK